MKKYIYPLAITATLLATAACSDDEVNAVDQPIPDSQKERISFSLSEGAGTRAGFPVATSIAMRIQSNEKGGTGVSYTRTLATAAEDANPGENSFSAVSFAGDAYTRYWDDAFGRKAQLSVFAVAIPNGAATLTNPISGDGAKTLEGLLAKGDETNTWGSNATNTIAWQVTLSNQTKDPTTATITAPGSSIDKEDLVYSNNIQADATLGKNGVYWYDFANSAWKPNEDGTGATTHGDGQMIFRQPAGAAASAPGKFDKGHLVFNHALTRLTVILKKDATSFSSGDFKFKDDTQITLYAMPVSGTFDIVTGSWVNTAEKPITKDNIAGMAKTSSETTPATAAGTYMAQMLPGYTFVKDNNTNVMDFTIDDNTYYITQGMIFKALNDNTSENGLSPTATSYTMEQGKNYSIEINVQKAGITNVTATLVKWNDIAGSLNIDNAHITITTKLFADATDANPDKYEENHSLENHYLLRHEEAATLTTTEPAAGTYVDFSGTYKDATTAAKITGTNKWTAVDWYFNNNLTAYHIRSINNKAKDALVTPTSETDPETYFTMANGSQASADYHWGAPMKDEATLVYSPTDGFSSSLYQGILSTKSDINITEFHMMSNIDVILTTPAVPTTSNNSVVLYDDSKATKGCKVEFLDVLTKATVDMGTGKVGNPSDRATDPVEFTPPTTYYATDQIKTNAFTYAFVPQSLSNGTGSDAKDVSVRITTPDGNTYFVPSLKDVFVNGSTTDKITEWLPNHHYVYTFNLTKTGIANITATLVKWETVTAGSTDINLEK